MNYLNRLQEKCHVGDELFAIIDQIFNKLLEFGYINRRQVKKLQKKLYQNIDTILFGNEVTLDYKTGYYDAVKKELYIKDIHNIEAVYLRILYVLTTNEIARDSYSVGYSTTSLSRASYKIIHQDFGINRAVISNLVCRLLYTIPTTLSIVPTYRTYENDFLGNRISSDNDIYFLEGKLLRQICYVLEVSEENLYFNLFNGSPKKYLTKFFAKAKWDNDTILLELLDDISRKYSNYNKLVYLNKKLNDNYLNIKKNILNDNVDALEHEQKKIKLAIQNALSPLIEHEETEEEQEFDVETSLSEEITKLEEYILDHISEVQNMLVERLITDELKFSNIAYAIKLKELSNILIVRNSKLETTLYETISHKLLNTFEETASNLTEKIKYSIINEILSSDKYIKIYKNMNFRKLEDITIEDNSALVALAIDQSFVQLIKVDHLDRSMKQLGNNTTTFHIENLGYQLNNPTTTQDINKIEKIFTSIKKKYTEFNKVKIESMYTCMIGEQKYVIVAQDDKFNILQLQEKGKGFTIKMVSLTEAYTVFNLRDNSLPVVYNKKESGLQKLMEFFALFS